MQTERRVRADPVAHSSIRLPAVRAGVPRHPARVLRVLLPGAARRRRPLRAHRDKVTAS